MYKVKREGDFSVGLNTDTFEERFQKLFKSGKKIVYIKNEFDSGTFRYRAYNIVQALGDQSEYVVTYFMTSELKHISRELSKIDLVIFQRAPWDVDAENFLCLCRRENIRVLYDLDDLIISPKYVPKYLNNLGIVNNPNQSYIDCFYYASVYYTLASDCDGFIATNKVLADIIKKDFSKPTWIIPNFLNKEQEYHSEIIKEKRQKDESKFLMGYFSGSPSHKFDLDIIVSCLGKLFQKYDDIYLKIVGFIDIPEELGKWRERIIQIPFVSYEELQYEIGEVDLNLVPLQNNRFNNCKSELKFFEAGIVEVPSCCSPTYVYKKIVKDGENGFICKEGEWFSKFESIYRGEYDINKISKNAFQTSLDLYGVENQEEQIVKVYKDILEKL